MPTTNYIWDTESDNILLETDGSNATKVTYTNEPSEFGNFVSQRRGSTTSTPQFDATGSTRQMTDSAHATSDTRLYSAFGETLVSTGTTVFNLQWIGELGYYLDPETGLFEVRQRSYQPGISRWRSVDPLLFIQATNGWTYVFNRPIVLVDPSGAESEKPKIGSCPSLMLKFAAFIPKDLGMVVEGVPASVRDVHWLDEPYQFNLFTFEKFAFGTDNRSTPGSAGTSRIYTQTIEAIAVASIGNLAGKSPLLKTECDESHQIKHRTSISSVGPPTKYRWRYVEGSLISTTQTPIWKEEVADIGPCCSKIFVKASGTHPFSPSFAPGIDYEVTWILCRNESNVVSIRHHGAHNEFPAYESLIGDFLLYSDLPTSSGPGWFNLGLFTDSFLRNWMCQG